VIPPTPHPNESFLHYPSVQRSKKQKTIAQGSFSFPFDRNSVDISKGETLEFKTPYLPGELALRPFQQKLEFMIKAEGALIGWGFILVTPQGVQGPPMQDHCRCPNGHPRRGLEKLIRKKHRNISRSVAYSVDIFIHPKFLDRSTVILDPDAQQFPVAMFLEHPSANMVLANGHRRIHCVKQMMSLRPPGEDSIPWLAKFYDLGESQRINPSP